MQYLEYEAADFLSVQLIPLTVCEKVYAPFLISTFFFFAFLLHPFASAYPIQSRSKLIIAI